ncbi:hypothetical protein AVEN_123651-2-1, partial [Araneus ventricosus]
CTEVVSEEENAVGREIALPSDSSIQTKSLQRDKHFIWWSGLLLLMPLQTDKKPKHKGNGQSQDSSLGPPRSSANRSYALPLYHESFAFSGLGLAED